VTIWRLNSKICGFINLWNALHLNSKKHGSQSIPLKIRPATGHQPLFNRFSAFDSLLKFPHSLIFLGCQNFMHDTYERPQTIMQSSAAGFCPKLISNQNARKRIRDSKYLASSF